MSKVFQLNHLLTLTFNNRFIINKIIAQEISLRKVKMSQVLSKVWKSKRLITQLLEDLIQDRIPHLKKEM